MASQNRNAPDAVSSPTPQDLERDATRYEYLQLLRMLRLIGVAPDDAAAPRGVRTRPSLTLGIEAGEVASAKRLPDGRWSITANVFGLYGPGSPLPVYYTEDLLEEAREGRHATRGLIDLLNHVLYPLLFRCWEKDRIAQRIVEALDTRLLQGLQGFAGVVAPRPAVLPAPKALPPLLYLALLQQPPARVRMATPYAGSHHGLHLPLLAGTEVLVAFRDGDPDQPLITAAVPNSENPSLARHDNAFIHQLHTAGGNTLLLDDRDGRQALRMHSPSSNSSLSLGSSSPDSDSAGIELSTSGGRAAVIAGSRYDISFGGAQSTSLGVTGVLHGAYSIEASILSACECNLRGRVAWSRQPTQAIGNGSWEQRGPECQLQADSDLRLGAGLDAATVQELEGYRRRIRRAIAAASLGYLGIGASLVAVDFWRNRGPQVPKPDSVHWLKTAAITLVRMAPSLALHRVVDAALRAIDQRSSGRYASSLELQSQGSNLRHSGEQGQEQSLRVEAGLLQLRSETPEGAASELRVEADALEHSSPNTRLRCESEPASLKLAAGPGTRLVAREDSLLLEADRSQARVLLQTTGVRVSCRHLQVFESERVRID
ncbi:type VI secretion system baseplate subunit TssG [Thiomonas sp. FB-6]|uniref:type VI secretion system baseplate subunit TssG n=1 Tax=Thiomonas sp. FB-6 TaxID=1158291 RepID=UPI0003749CCB|nr:type VI secretion system baseplate subunit TssG [Thiomonas sp. FB-6]